MLKIGFMFELEAAIRHLLFDSQAGQMTLDRCHPAAPHYVGFTYGALVILLQLKGRRLGVKSRAPTHHITHAPDIQPIVQATSSGPQTAGAWPVQVSAMPAKHSCVFPRFL